MNRQIAFVIVVTVVIAALVWSERHPADVRVAPAPLLYLIADSEWELSRLPMAATRLSDQEEIDIGNRLARNIYVDRANSYVTPEEKRQIAVVRNYVNRVGDRVAARAHRRLPYRFHFIADDNIVNAFALPGGHVYIGEGLIALMDSEDELAAVLGHEIEHIDHYHCAERVQTEARFRRIPLGRLVAIPATIFEAGYSKDQELEADREGTALAVRASYSPLGAVRMFETFDRLYQEYVRRAQSPQEELSRVAIQTLEGYFRSHPVPSERADQIRKLIAENNWGGLTHVRQLEVAYFTWTDRARQSYESGHYDAAARQAQHSLELKPEQPNAFRILGQAEYARANFSESAAAFRQAVDLLPAEHNVIDDYVDALAACHTPAASLQSFSAWADAHPGLKGQLVVRLGLARLTLAAKGEEAADALLFPALAVNAAALPPKLRSQYGWWLYGSGQYDAAANLLQSATQELPGDTLLLTRLGWALIEQHNLEAAMQRFEAVAIRYPISEYQPPGQQRRLLNDRRMGLAVAAWQAQQFGRASAEFSAVSIAQPEWLNPKWVKAVYSSGVAKTVEELEAARENHRPTTSPARFPPT